MEFPETCLVDEASAELPVTITVDWTRTAALPSGGILITTQVTATNPAHRIIDVSVVDKWYEGSTATGPAIHTVNGSASVPAATVAGDNLVPGTYTLDLLQARSPVRRLSSMTLPPPLTRTRSRA